MLKVRSVWVGILMAAVVTAVTVVYLNRCQSVFLSAKESVPVYATLEELRSPSSSTVAVIEPKQKIPVMRCIDVKHYQVYEVRLPDGKSGYVNIGKYDLTDRDGNLTSC
jgi:hypothetical protein